jgi:YD repeat-containing protein
VRTAEHNVAWQTTTKDECYNAPSCTGAMMVEKRDALGRVIEKDSYEEPSTLKTRTKYTYDSLGRLLTTQQGDATTWNASTIITIAYDSLGRKISMNDPDSGMWRYGYDLVGNLVYQDDPKSPTSTPPGPPQHLEFCYDEMNRVTDKFYKTDSDNYGPSQCGSARGQIQYNYDDTAVASGFGRLTRVDDQSGSTIFRENDVRGRVRRAEKQIHDLGGLNLKTATTSYQYDTADHVTQITYPDNEVVVYGYDQVGQAKSLRNTNATPTWYLTKVTYDVFGRSRVLTHGNTTTDTRAYGDKTKNFRLASILTKQGTSTTHLSLSYASYLPTGLLTRLDDLRDGSGQLSNSASFGYDGLGRLMSVTGNQYLNTTYDYDYLGNIRLKDGASFTYSTSRPHSLEKLNSGVQNVYHDANGNRTDKPAQSYTYDPDDRLIGVNGSAAQFGYDYTGRQVFRQAGTSTIRYYNELVEAGGGYLTKFYFAAGMRIATQRVATQQYGFLSPDAAVQVAQAPNDHAAFVLVLRDDVRLGVSLSVLLVGTVLVLAPWRRKRVVGIALRHGQVIMVVLTFAVTTLPVPLVCTSLAQVAQAQAPGDIYHYHLDHLGSTQVITRSDGSAILRNKSTISKSERVGCLTICTKSPPQSRETRGVARSSMSQNQRVRIAFDRRAPTG